ncbi:MAG: hypothetical protein VX278_20730 [Myxococcota bacterium]|nr:hypothetical protein [Myxococcota bacterium]
MRLFYILAVLVSLLLPRIVIGSEIIPKSNELWLVRDQENHCLEAIALLEEAAKKEPSEFQYHWHLSRFYYWAAAEAKTKKEKQRYAKRGWDAANKATELKPESVEGWYWATANIGLYGEAVGIFGAMRHGLGDVYTQNANKAIAIDPLYDDGGPYRSLGRYYTKLPWPMKDLEKSISLIEKSIAQNRQRALTLYFYADAQEQLGNKAEAKKYFEEILALSATGPYAPEIRRYQGLSTQRLSSF